MKSLEELKEIIEQHRQELERKYKVKSIAIFGSYVREEQTEGSDIDILVDLEEEADLFDLVGLGEFLEKHLLRKVDLVTKRALRKELREQVLKEAAML